MSVTDQGATVWLTGLPSAGKTTIADALADRLRGEGHRVEVLDGDEIREFLSAGLGFSREDRHTNVQRIGFVAELLASQRRQGAGAGDRPVRGQPGGRPQAARRARAPRTWRCTWPPRSRCAPQRDVKGLYAKQAAGEITGLTGVDDPYEAPESPDLRIESHRQSVPESAAALHALLTERGLA